MFRSRTVSATDVGAATARHTVWIVLYTVTLAGQWLAVIARAIILYVVLALIGLVTGWPIPANTIAVVLALAPLAISLLALICPPLIAPLDGRWWEISVGGRPPEPAEQDAYQYAIDQLHTIEPNLRTPKHWFIAETYGHNASAYASSLCVDRGLLESPYASAVIAHELGHLNNGDARLSSALNLMLLKPTPRPELYPLWSLPFRGLWWLATGQAVMWFTAHAWDMYWRSREYAADEYAAKLGQANTLAEALELDALPYEQPIPRMAFSRATHPYTTPRIAKLRAHPTPPDTTPQEHP